MDSCKSDVHCPVCVLISCKESYKKDKNVNNKENSKYCIKHVKTRWNQEHTLLYLIFNILKYYKIN